MADQACTLADVKAQLAIPDTTDDAWLTSAIEGVTDYMQAYTRRLLVPHSGVTVLLDTAAGNEIEVPQGVRAVTSLSVAASDQPDTGGAWPTAIASSSIALRPAAQDRPDGLPATRIVIIGSTIRLVDAINGAQLVGDLGPATTPARFARMAVEAVAAAYTNRKAGSTGVIGADDGAAIPWASYFAWSTPQGQSLRRLRGVGIA